ncbi:signal peptide peptidase SppA [Solitalea sp. MAHUQ-68]|uniref:Signal peptide peptidase SppA n=1 Tax=Solitalea agri TaxID=2953739 RepID=A0A9X2F2Y4_9SPHI|nr:signal peptide peptidase SppA [Solitalea agri]MCO4291406.1 signal peptide peptidase SppA [Solitalea agri]
MAQFFKFVFASMLGTFLTLVIACILLVSIIVGIVNSASKEKNVQVSDNSILMLNFDYEIPERTPSDPFADYNYNDLQSKNTVGLNDILSGIKKAKDDPKISGIYINTSSVGGGFATTEEIRNALLDFKESKKFIVAYSEYYTQKGYYIASTADKIYLNPVGEIEFKGFGSQIMFLKGALEKLEIEPQVIKVGTYKSAVEPLLLDKMSDANRLQTTSFLGSMYTHFLTRIGQSRNIQSDSLRTIANKLLIQKADDAIKYNLADDLKYKDEVITDLKARTDTKPEDDLNVITLKKYKSADIEIKEDLPNDRVAIVYASGEINGGEGDDNSIGSERISRAIREVREDKKVKAIVFRVNSPGGSALASDVIWREIALAKKVKPVVVSMGDYAASGGYYISCAATKIYAEPNTITGSIGVFGVIPNAQKFFNNKLGVTFDGVKTGEYADMGTISRPLTESERVILQQQVNNTYGTFTKKVADGRKKTAIGVDSIGQGRVWSGIEALEIGLIDKLGGLNEAIIDAAKLANTKNYRIVSYPSQKSILDSFLGNVTDDIQTSILKKELGEEYKIYQQIKKISKLNGIQARLPFEISIN